MGRDSNAPRCAVEATSHVYDDRADDKSENEPVERQDHPWSGQNSGDLT